MTMDMHKAERIVGAIDKRIDAVRAELLRNEAVDEMSAGSWQAAWDRHPVLRAIERSLFLRRADAHDVLALIVTKQMRAAERHEQREFKRQYEASRHDCPTCGQVHYATA